jgi:hypothetical protein
MVEFGGGAMRAWLSVATVAGIGALMLGLATVSLTTGCWPGCDPYESVESGDYVIDGVAGADPRPEDRWLLDAVVGALLTVDREANETTIRYTHDGTTSEVHYTLE